MNWLLYALASTITFTVITALDKILIARFTPNPRTFIVLVGLTQFILAIVVTPWVVWTGYGAIDIAVAIISGIASGGYLVLMFWVMGQQDVSRVIPVTSTYPIFVAVLAFLFLGETIGLLAWVGIIVTVAGACLMSLGPTVRADQDRSGEKLAFALLVVASLGFGLSQFFSEVVEDDMTLWTLFFWRAIGNGAACVGFTDPPQRNPRPAIHPPPTKIRRLDPAHRRRPSIRRPILPVVGDLHRPRIVSVHRRRHPPPLRIRLRSPPKHRSRQHPRRAVRRQKSS